MTYTCTGIGWGVHDLYCSTPPGGVKMLWLYIWAALMFIFIRSQLWERPGCQTDLEFPETFSSQKPLVWFPFLQAWHPHPPLLQPGQPWDGSGVPPHYVTLKEPFCSLGRPHGSFALCYFTVCGRAACPLVWPLRHKDGKAWFVISLVHWRGLSLHYSL